MPRSRKTLTTIQLRVLKALASSPTGEVLATLSRAAGVIRGGVGRTVAALERHGLLLIERVKYDRGLRRCVYHITPKGRTAIKHGYYKADGDD